MKRAAMLAGAALMLATAACNNNGGGGDAANVEETPNGVTQIPPPGTDMNSVANAISPTPTDAPNYAKMAAIADMYEIQAGKLAQQKAQSAGLKSFGAQMVTDHTATTEAMTRAVSQAGLNLAPPTSLDAKHQQLIDALTAASGADFDRLYRDQQITAHEEALALHQNFAANGDTPPLKEVASATAPKVEQHLTMLRGMQ